MVKAWFLPEQGDWGDRRDPGLTNPPHYVDIDEVCRTSGIKYRKIVGDDFESSEQLKQLHTEFDFSAQDVLIVNDEIPQEKFDKFYEEHLHPFDEVRLMMDGDAYFDIRDINNRWIRTEVVKGDLIIIPPGLYHRFTPTSKNYVKMSRYFIGHMTWVAHNRADSSTDQLPERVNYLESMASV